MSALSLALAVLLAWLLDAAFGEPRSAWHPVAWFGRTMSLVGRRVPDLGRTPAFVAGAALWLAAVSAAGALAWAVQAWALSLPAWLGVPLLALALKPTFAWRMLKDEVHAVDAALAHGAQAGRSRLARLCSREVQPLDATQVREAAIETLAENLNDSLVAPLWWFVLAGLPGAWAWRASNTLDAMWGYRGRWEWAGKWAARADDVLGWAPARTTALLLWRPAVGWRFLQREARRTPSPNGGWPMATMALRLRVRLGKPGVYSLNAAAAPPDSSAVQRALQAAGQAARMSVLLTVVVLVSLPWQR